jgi:tetratricopeptide (TPR) repeat protein
MVKNKVTEKTIKKLWEDCFKAILKQDWKKAISLLGQIEALEPDNPQVHLKTGDILQRTGDRPGALASYHQAALCLINQGFKQKAIAIYKVILRLEPNDNEALTMSKNIIEEIEAEKTASPLAHMKKDVPEEGPVEGETAASLPPADDAALPDEPFPGSQVHEGLERTEQAEIPSEEKVPLIFSSLSDEEFKELRKRAAHRTFGDGEAVVHEGDRGDSMFTIKRGRARVTTRIRDKTLELATLSEGDFFGEVAFLTRRPRTASVAAEGELQVMDISREILQQFIKRHPQVMDGLVEFYYSRVKDTLLKVKGR